MSAREPYNVMITGMGGQGLVTLSRVIATAASLAGWGVGGSEKRGGAQRGGAAEITLRLLPPGAWPADAYAAGVAHGQLDLLVALEPLEAWRQVVYTSARTLALVDISPVEPALARQVQFQTPAIAEILAGIGAAGARVVSVDLVGEAKRQWGRAALGNVTAMGWLAAAAVLPFDGAVMRPAAETVLGARGLHAAAWAAGEALSLES